MAIQKFAVTRRPAQIVQYARQQVRVRRRTVDAAESRQLTLLIVRWGLAAICLGMLATGETGTDVWVWGLPVIAILSASNLILARLRPEMVEGAALSIAIGLVDAVLVVTAWYASGHESFTVVILALCLLNLALVGVTLGELSAIATAALIVYSIIGQVD